jgi:hypothetical protein
MIMLTCQTLLQGKCNKKDSGTRKRRKEETLTCSEVCEQADIGDVPIEESQPCDSVKHMMK